MNDLGLRIGSLFSGIGGLEIGLERAGLGHTVWHSEIDPYCSGVLERRWPGVPNFGDIVSVDPRELGPVDVVCGGFPCQPVSQAAARSERGEGWLWPEMRRIVAACNPRIVVVENPAALRYSRRGMGEVLDDLSALGFLVEWRVVRASQLGSPHQRARLWLVAYSDSDWKPVFPVNAEAQVVRDLTEAFPEWGAVPSLPLDDGIPKRLAVSALGNAVVPRCAEFVGRCIRRAIEGMALNEQVTTNHEGTNA